MAVPVGTKPYETGDLVIREGLPREFTASTVLITNGGSTTWNLLAGQPFTGNAPTVGASLSSFNALLMEATVLRPAEAKKLGFYRKNPSTLASGLALTINQSALPTVDMAGAVLTASDFKTALETQLGCVVIPEAANQDIAK